MEPSASPVWAWEGGQQPRAEGRNGPGLSAPSLLTSPRSVDPREVTVWLMAPMVTAGWSRPAARQALPTGPRPPALLAFPDTSPGLSCVRLRSGSWGTI